MRLVRLRGLSSVRYSLASVAGPPPGRISPADILARDGAALLEVPGYTEHVEPPEQGGERYFRCEACARELLCSLGGRENLLHVDGCPNAE